MRLRVWRIATLAATAGDFSPYHAAASESSARASRLTMTRFNRLRKSCDPRTPMVRCFPALQGARRVVCEARLLTRRKLAEGLVNPESTPRSRRRAEDARGREVCGFRRCQSRADCTSDAYYSTFRESPTLFVTPSRSIHSSSGMAILRERPKYSLKWPTSIMSPRRTPMRSRAAARASRWT